MYTKVAQSIDRDPCAHPTKEKAATVRDGVQKGSGSKVHSDGHVANISQGLSISICISIGYIMYSSINVQSARIYRFSKIV